jgi:flagellar basal-body rod protein FlgB
MEGDSTTFHATRPLPPLPFSLSFSFSSPPRMSLIDTTQLALESAARGAWARQTLLTNNISNANTPGYRREDLNFQGALRAALASGESPAQVQFQPEVSSQVVGPEGNGVDVDQESAQLAENGLEYEALVQVMGTRNEIMRSAMGVG